MRSSPLLGGNDSVIAKPVHQRRIVVAAPLPHSSGWNLHKERRQCATFVVHSLVNEAEPAEYGFKPWRSTFLYRGLKASRRQKASCRPVVVSTNVTAMDSADQGFDDFDEYNKGLAYYRGLVLDVSYRPINIVCWRRALCLEILEKADVLEYYDQVISSPSRPFLIPAVLRITDYVYTPVQSKVKLSLNRSNIFLRDKYRCQYCGSQDNLTVDHVIPYSRGGEWNWRNLVTACSVCNTKKGNKTLEESNMQLLKTPKEPRELYSEELPSNYAAFRSMQNSRRMPTEWAGYLPKRFQPMDYC
ncbi:hypothetical protein KP509_15G065700 [Ceratopteris richardii]|uniref:HNH nuclease domain-containing protein n=1 Tax=Ceratopteris richardii TaxID=49495 RepID=A0A8T2T4A9_CERRI|nr:hypothetical protein KP509_15G065700 [Ceratopteris richardii]